VSRGPVTLTSSDGWCPPVEFEDYRIVRMLGRGSMGEVYLAHDRVLDRPIAIKFIGRLDPTARERFLVEARATARIQHPNVMAIFRTGEVDGHPYIVSEYIPGGSLEQFALPIAWLEALGLAVGLARGLAAAHRQGVLHRDIKLANALLDADGTIKLVDFGLAKLLAEAVSDGPGAALEQDPVVSLDATAAGTLLGTPNFMAPELWRAEPASCGSDVYALGVLLSMLCLGRAPLDAETWFELGERVQREEPPPLALRVPGIDPQFAAIIDRCVRRSPDERYTSGEEVRAALEALVPLAHVAPANRGDPYRGLRPFEAEHRVLFFGRAREVQTVVERLRTHSFVVVTGDSGVGKSSLCRAGVLPAVRDGVLDPARTWTAAAIHPDRRPGQALVAALACCLQQLPATVSAAIDEDSARFVRGLRRDLAGDRGIVLFVDQLEELITLADPFDAASTAHLLALLIADIPGVRVLATARSDFLTRIAELPGLRDELQLALYFLLPLAPEGLHAAIVGPAQARGVRFESAQLVDQLAAVAVAGSLSLLQFALTELWEARDASGAIITATALSRIGGVSAALARHADLVVARLTPGQRRTARTMLMRLVTADGARASLSADELLLDSESQEVLDALLAGRLLVARAAPDGIVYEFAHESLIPGWPSLQSWLDSDLQARVVRHRIESDAGEWQRLAHAKDLLWGNRRLAEAGLVDPAALRPREQAFLTASRGRVRGRRTFIRAAVIVVSAVLLAALLGVHRAGDVDLTRRIAVHQRAATVALGAAQARRAEGARHREAAFAAFASADCPAGEAAWALARASAPETAHLLDAASDELASAMDLDPTRPDLRGEYAAVLRERASHAEHELLTFDADRRFGRFACPPLRAAF